MGVKWSLGFLSGCLDYVNLGKLSSMSPNFYIYTVEMTKITVGKSKWSNTLGTQLSVLSFVSTQMFVMVTAAAVATCLPALLLGKIGRVGILCRSALLRKSTETWRNVLPSGIKTTQGVGKKGYRYFMLRESDSSEPRNQMLRKLESWWNHAAFLF